LAKTFLKHLFFGLSPALPSHCGWLACPHRSLTIPIIARKSKLYLARHFKIHNKLKLARPKIGGSQHSHYGSRTTAQACFFCENSFFRPTMATSQEP
jgi:hypothetical protein